jgi:diguanylate cyclase
MKNNQYEYEQTLAIAETALNQIRSLRLAANPRNFEIWYTYAAGYNQNLNQAINETLIRESRLTEHELGQIYDRHLSTIHLNDQADDVGGKIMDEIEQVMAMIDGAIGTTSTYNQSLAGAAKHISDEKPVDRDQLRSIVTTLLGATREIEIANQALQSRLVESRTEIRELQQNLEKVRAESLIDPLTTLSNRKYFQDAIARFMGEAERKGVPFSVVLTDIDHFKKFNDAYGHLTGDQVLRLVALALKNNLKGQDVCARYGGEEFAVLLPRTGLQSAEIVANHIRRAVMGKELLRRSTNESLGRVTISLGVASWRKGDTVAVLLERADTCLYAAKHAGRNCAISEISLRKPEQQVA